jgi:hypothetical protein
MTYSLCRSLLCDLTVADLLTLGLTRSSSLWRTNVVRFGSGTFVSQHQDLEPKEVQLVWASAPQNYPKVLNNS